MMKRLTMTMVATACVAAYAQKTLPPLEGGNADHANWSEAYAARDDALPLFTVGAVADVQYADAEPHGGRTPRESPRRLQKAVDSFNARKVDFAISLGDLVDWDDIDYSKFPASTEAVEPVDWTHVSTIAAIWEQIQAPRHYVLGNHEWCVPDRAADGEKPGRVLRRYGFEDKAYYDFSHKGFRFVILDGTDGYMYAYPRGSDEFLKAQACLKSQGNVPRNRSWNGAISDAQLEWLSETLSDAAREREKVVLCCHFPIHDPEDGHTLLNYQAVRKVLDACPNVVLWLNGHDHRGGYALMNKGQPSQRHHLNLKGMQNGDDRYYRLEFFEDRIDVYRAEEEKPEHTMSIAALSEPTEAASPSSSHMLSPKDYSCAYWKNGWRKSKEDASPNILCFESGYYGFMLDVAKLAKPKFGRFDDDSNVLSCLEAGTRRMDGLSEADLDVSLELKGKRYSLESCLAGESGNLAFVRMMEAGQVAQHFDIQHLVFKDAEGKRLGCYGDLDMVAWPNFLTFTLRLMPDFLYSDGPSEGVVGSGLCIIEKPLDIPHRDEIDPEVFTLECWMKIPKSIQTTGNWLLCKNTHNWQDGHIGIRYWGRHMSAELNIGGGPENRYTLNFAHHKRNEWNHLALTYDGNEMKTYLNGNPSGSTAIGKKRNPGSGLLRIGKRADGNSTVLKGLYDQIRIWDRPLSAAEIRAHAQNPGTIPSQKGVVLDKNFDGGKVEKQEIDRVPIDYSATQNKGWCRVVVWPAGRYYVWVK